MNALWLRFLILLSIACLALPGQAVTDDEVQVVGARLNLTTCAR